MVGSQVLGAPQIAVLGSLQRALQHCLAGWAVSMQCCSFQATCNWVVRVTYAGQASTERDDSHATSRYKICAWIHDCLLGKPNKWPYFQASQIRPMSLINLTRREWRVAGMRAGSAQTGWPELPPGLRGFAG